MKTFVKILIWVGAFIVALIANVIGDIIWMALFGGRMGYMIRYSVLFGPLIPLGRALSKRCDKRCYGYDPNSIDDLASAAGKSRREYLIDHSPEFIIDICDGDYTVATLYDMLKPYVKEGMITNQIAKALAEEFGTK